MFYEGAALLRYSTLSILLFSSLHIQIFGKITVILTAPALYTIYKATQNLHTNLSIHSST
jgi:hypothetical protein